jgi:hypothetical protein
MRKIWYLSYGSNILEQRFLCYIKGGIPKGIDKKYEGCRDMTLPQASEEIYITGELYFAKSSTTWKNKGVAFLSQNSEMQTKAKMYLITEEQLVDVIKQENNSEIDFKIDYEELEKSESITIAGINWYNKILFLGKKENSPIVTFTHENDEFLNQINCPDEIYLKIIMEGLMESFNCNEFDLLEYFENLKGIKECYSKDKLIELAKSI